MEWKNKPWYIPTVKEHIAVETKDNYINMDKTIKTISKNKTNKKKQIEKKKNPYRSMYIKFKTRQYEMT